MKTEELPAFFDGLERVGVARRDGALELVDLRRARWPGDRAPAELGARRAAARDRASRGLLAGRIHAPRTRPLSPSRSPRRDGRARTSSTADSGRAPTGRCSTTSPRRGVRSSPSTPSSPSATPPAATSRCGSVPRGGRRLRCARRRLRSRRGRAGGARGAMQCRSSSAGRRTRCPRRTAWRTRRRGSRWVCRRCWSTEWTTTACRSRTRRHTRPRPGRRRRLPGGGDRRRALRADRPRSAGLAGRARRNGVCIARRSPEAAVLGRHRVTEPATVAFDPTSAGAAGGSVHRFSRTPGGSSPSSSPRSSTLGRDPPRRRPHGPQGPPDVLLGRSAHLGPRPSGTARGDGDPRGRPPRDAVHHRGRPSAPRPDPRTRRARLHAAADRGARAAHRADRRRPDRRVRRRAAAPTSWRLRVAAPAQRARRAFRISRGRSRAHPPLGHRLAPAAADRPAESWPGTRGASSSFSATASPPSRTRMAPRPTTCSAPSSPQTTRRTTRSASSRSRACRST